MTDPWANFDHAVEQMRAAAIEYDAARARLRVALAALPDARPEAAPEPQADADGWIKWEGGDCPVPLDTRVEGIDRDGCSYSPREARYLVWRHTNHAPGDDIIAYRIVRPEGPTDA